MIKNKLDFKLINITLIALTIFLLYQTSNLWVGLISTLFKIIFPFLVSFVIAYALYPFVKLLEKYKISSSVSNTKDEYTFSRFSINKRSLPIYQTLYLIVVWTQRYNLFIYWQKNIDKC